MYPFFKPTFSKICITLFLVFLHFLLVYMPLPHVSELLTLTYLLISFALLSPLTNVLGSSYLASVVTQFIVTFLLIFIFYSFASLVDSIRSNYKRKYRRK